MRVLLDEMLPIGIRELLPGHEVVTASYAGLAEISNGGGQPALSAYAHTPGLGG